MWCLSSDVRNGDDGTRFYGELNTGVWWEKTVEMEEMPSDATLLPVILYTDGTNLSSNGSHSIKPLAVSIGNFPRVSPNQDASKMVVCYMPGMPTPKALRKKEVAKSAKRQLHHDVLYEVFRPIRQAQQAGGFWALCNGKREKFMPVMCLVPGDNPEQQLMCLISAHFSRSLLVDLGAAVSKLLLWNLHVSLVDAQFQVCHKPQKYSFNVRQVWYSACIWAVI